MLPVFHHQTFLTVKDVLRLLRLRLYSLPVVQFTFVYNKIEGWDYIIKNKFLEYEAKLSNGF